jgi:AcrR family transcriptional regulator
LNNQLYMKMRDLSRLAQVPPSTIRFYVKEGLLPQPIKTGKTIGYYSQDHLDRIEFIKEMQMKKGLSVEEIKQEIKKTFTKTDPNQKPSGKIYSLRRGEIIRSAIDLFREKGYSNTSITDIAKHAKIGRDTFYQNFTNKEELFIECADRIFYELYNDAWEEIKSEKDMQKRFEKRREIFLSSYTKWIDIMNLVRGISVRKISAFDKKLEQLMDQIMEPNIRDLERAKKQGYLTEDMDSMVLGYMLMGSSEYCGYLIHQKKINPELVHQSMKKVIGLILRKADIK